MIEMHGRFSPDTAAQVAAAHRAVRAALDRGAGPARERGGAGTCPAGDEQLDRDRRADPHDLGRGAVHRGRRRRHHPGRPDPFRWLHRCAPAGGLDRGPLPDARPAQRRRTGRDRGQRPLRGRRPGTSTSSSISTTSPTPGSASSSTTPRSSTRPTAASPSRSDPVSASARPRRLRQHPPRAPDCSSSWKAGRSARAGDRTARSAAGCAGSPAGPSRRPASVAEGCTTTGSSSGTRSRSGSRPQRRPFLGVFLARFGATPFQLGLFNALPSIFGLVLAIPLGQFLLRRSSIPRWLGVNRMLSAFTYGSSGIFPFFVPAAAVVPLSLLVWTISAVPQLIVPSRSTSSCRSSRGRVGGSSCSAAAGRSLC